ncbi:hypothetical protein GCM10010228_39980 [Streptomyces massasporeus]|nr:hypothetical protein GCM10010228_39980 [Streptomyces massasporeus]
MADANFSAASPSAHPMANPGYGKRTTPGQLPGTNHAFAHLPPREAAIAAYLDRLPDSADISVKTLANQLPYGQCALGTALNRIRARPVPLPDRLRDPRPTRDGLVRTGASEDDVLRALTAGLPTPVHHAAALVRNRLTSKLPPPPAPRPPLRVLECANCGAPGRPETLPGGRCSACRGERAPAQSAAPLSAPTVHAHAAGICAAMSRRRHDYAD